ncbi:hypothetical protein [Paludibacterium yongneupense]|uniref:hypothetical protein n=1 Tax=Paludibacterium yongneupense TaxID=400061 RepID=UPI0012EB9946|nr:hypothetical protein [Paludibacterium yongneupense]
MSGFVVELHGYMIFIIDTTVCFSVMDKAETAGIAVGAKVLLVDLKGLYPAFVSIFSRADARDSRPVFECGSSVVKGVVLFHNAC